MEEPPSKLGLEQALAFADACELGSDDELGGDLTLDALLADTQAQDLLGGGHGANSSVACFTTPLSPPPLLAATASAGAVSAAGGAADVAPPECGTDDSLENVLAVLGSCELGHTGGVATAFDSVARTTESKTADAKDEETAAKNLKRALACSPTRAAFDTPADGLLSHVAPGHSPSSCKVGKKKTPAGKQADVPLKKPTKKRVRRQREELLYLRGKVKEMESSLAELQGKEAKSAKASPNSSPSVGQAVTSSNKVPKQTSETVSPLLASVWESLANRQYRDRERAEQENRKLKSTLEGQLKLAKCLEKILQDQPDADILSAPSLSDQSKLLATANGNNHDAVFAQLRAEINVGFEEFEPMFESSRFAALEKEQLDVELTSNKEKGLLVEFIAVKRVPFPLEVAWKGMWRFSSCEAAKNSAYFYREHNSLSQQTVARTFGVKVKGDKATLDYRVENMMERRQIGDRVIIMSRGIATPIKFTAAPVYGVRFHEVGWFVLEKIRTTGGTLDSAQTKITTGCELMPMYDSAASEQDLGVGALTDFVIESINRNVHLGESMIADIMGEEASKHAAQKLSWV